MEKIRELASSQMDQKLLKNVMSSESSVLRLVILDLAISTRRFQNFIETGTQHGLSAYIAGEVANNASPGMNLTSFDVSHDQYHVKSEWVNYIRLERPARRSFKNISSQLNNDSLIFFHDSDHSYENMLFELEWAWNVLSANLMISDDIDGNDAFFDFCIKNQVDGFRVMLEGGPGVGIAIRGT